MSQEKRFTRGERALISFGILVPTLVLAWVGVDRKLNTVPDFVPPPQSIPAPNAMETLRSAYNLRVNTWEKPKTRFEDTLKMPLAERQKNLAANEKVITRVREALNQSYATPIDWHNPMAQTFPQYAEHRELARQLALASATYAEMGNRKEAIRCALDAIEMGIMVGGDGPIIGYLVGTACETIGRKALWDQLDALTPEEAGEALTRLESLEKRRNPSRKFLTVERAYAQKIISDLAHRTIKPADFVTPTNGNTENGAEQGKLMLALALTDKGKAWKASGQYYDTLEDYWSRPYTRGVMPQPPGDTINQILAPVFEQAYFNTTRNLTDSALLRGCLKIKAQSIPASFDAPADPFNQNQPLHYEKKSDGYRLWSVGPDGKDNGGSPIPAKNNNSHVYEATQDGDVVARINTF
ncbi:MAG: hypothetical protein QM758_00950 [Armatimonas sp.]